MGLNIGMGRRRISLADVQPLRKFDGKAGGHDRFCGFLDSVLDAPECRRPAVRVEQQPGGARVPVARLADAAWVDHPLAVAKVEYGARRRELPLHARVAANEMAG